MPVVIFRHVRDPKTGKRTLMGFPYHIENEEVLPAVLAEVDRLVAELEGRHD